MTDGPKPRVSRAETLWAAVRKSPERAATPGSMTQDVFGVTGPGYS